MYCPGNLVNHFTCISLFYVHNNPMGLVPSFIDENTPRKVK